MTEIERLKAMITQLMNECDPQDATSIIWYGRFLTLIDVVEETQTSEINNQQ